MIVKLGTAKVETKQNGSKPQADSLTSRFV